MGRAYAGHLGLVAFGLMVLRGVVQGGGHEQTLLAASAALFVFAALGYVIGSVAEHLVNESVRTQFQAAMATWEEKPGEMRTQK
jgi:hypothetical protein